MLNEKDKKQKAFLKALRRLKKIREELNNRPLLPLKEPYQSGWIIYCTLRDDISRRNDADAITEAVKAAFGEILTKDVQDVKAVRAGKFFRVIRKNKVAIRSFVNKGNIFEKEYNKLSEKAKKLFYHDKYDTRYIYSKMYAISIPNYWIKLKVKPNIITHYKEKGGPLEKEKAEIESYLEEYWRTYPYGKIYFYSNKRSEIKIQIRKILKNEIEEININNKKIYRD